tara:strand:- start:1236 stop:1415 length:180 start_codon:yes stop_codon:yes gene_type:complete
MVGKWTHFLVFFFLLFFLQNALVAMKISVILGFVRLAGAIWNLEEAADVGSAMHNLQGL